MQLDYQNNFIIIHVNFIIIHVIQKFYENGKLHAYKIYCSLNVQAIVKYQLTELGELTSCQ